MAVDLHQAFLNELHDRADRAGVGHQVSTLKCSMDELPFQQDEFDVIWSEGAVYNVGFEKGVSKWKRFLKQGGILVVSEITWLTNERPGFIQDFWEEEYQEIDVASAKIGILEQEGYLPIGYFPLPRECWVDNYYDPIRNRADAFLKRHAYSQSALALLESERSEMNLYEQFGQYYSYGMYVARKI